MPPHLAVVLSCLIKLIAVYHHRWCKNSKSSIDLPETGCHAVLTEWVSTVSLWPTGHCFLFLETVFTLSCLTELNTTVEIHNPIPCTTKHTKYEISPWFLLLHGVPAQWLSSFRTLQLISLFTYLLRQSGNRVCLFCIAQVAHECQSFNVAMMDFVADGSEVPAKPWRRAAAFTGLVGRQFARGEHSSVGCETGQRPRSGDLRAVAGAVTAHQLLADTASNHRGTSWRLARTRSTHFQRRYSSSPAFLMLS